jgi:hypothetical protein
MSLSVAVIDALLASGASREQIAAAVKADISDRDAAEAAKLEAKREGNRERQRRKREREGNAKSRVTSVTARDERDAPPNEDNNLTPREIVPDEASASSPARQPIADATACWNENAGKCGWPQVRALSPNRQKLLAARLRQHGIDGWQAAIAKARASPFLAGHDPPSWFTFPWLIKAENFLKLIEGNYDRRTEHRPNSMGRHQSPDGLSPTTRAALDVFGP